MDNADNHLGGSYLEQNDGNTYMPDLWEYLIDKYNIHSVVDVGCGAGWNTVWFHKKGLYAVGIEGWPDAIAKTKMPMERMIVHDYADGALPIPRTDLCWCSEFVEHVEEQFIPNYMATFKCCRYVCMTYAIPEQTGFHHVNEQELPYWIDKMSDAGFEHLEQETKYLRSTANPDALWGRKTLTFFKNKAF
jgi:SAM-dependent methyltransferase